MLTGITSEKGYISELLLKMEHSKRKRMELTKKAQRADELELARIDSEIVVLAAEEMLIQRDLTRWGEQWRLQYQPEATLSALCAGALQGVLMSGKCFDPVNAAEIAFRSGQELHKLLTRGV